MTACTSLELMWSQGVVKSLAFSGNSKYLLSGHSSGVVILWDLRKKEAAKDWTVCIVPLKPSSTFTVRHESCSLQDSKASVTAVAFNGDDTFAAAGNLSGEIFVWEVPSTSATLGGTHLYYRPSDKVFM